jgi:hypothetical protein
MTSTEITPPFTTGSQSAGHYHHRQAKKWRSTFMTQRGPAWPAILAVLTLLGLLLTFQQVVRAAVRQGEARRAATAAHSAAYWRCQDAQRGLVRESCQTALKSSPHDDATPRLGKVTTVESVAQGRR